MAQSIVSLKGFFTFVCVTALLWDVASFPLFFATAAFETLGT
jgi:hypothetical protein